MDVRSRATGRARDAVADSSRRARRRTKDELAELKVSAHGLAAKAKSEAAAEKTRQDKLATTISSLETRIAATSDAAAAAKLRADLDAAKCVASRGRCARRA